MIFLQIKTEDLVQTGDKTRIDISKSFISGASPVIEKYEIEPEVGAGYVDVTGVMHLDWVYETDGNKVVTVRATDDLAVEYSKSTTLLIITPEQDNLFSGDQDIVPYEDDILNFVRKGRASFLDKHRSAQQSILNELDANRIWKRDGTRYVASDIVDIQEFKEWSKFAALRIIYEGISNDVADIFSVKSTKYQTLEISAKKRATLRLDPNQDDVNEESEKIDIFSGSLVKR
jgi:hypothetical protein